MTKENRVDEVKELADGIFINCPACLVEEECEMIARYVVEEQGYRKASDVAREFIDWLQETDCINYSEEKRKYLCEEFIAELKKKYESEDTNNANL